MPGAGSAGAGGAGIRGALAAGLVYFLLVFAAGFGLGVIRTTVVLPLTGPLLAVIVEVPVMLAVSWLACRRVVARSALPAAAPLRLAMGATAFALLMAAEAGLSMLASGRTLAEHLALYRQAHALVGLAAQVAFAMIPAIQPAVDRGRGREPGPPRR